MPPPTFWCHPDAPEPLICAETPNWLEPDKLIVYGRYRSPEGVAMCKSLLGCLGVDPRKSQNKGMEHLHRRFSPPDSQFPGVFWLIVQKVEREKSISVKPKHKE